MKETIIGHDLEKRVVFEKTGLLIKVRNWLLIKLANGNPVALNIELRDGTMTFYEGQKALAYGCNFIGGNVAIRFVDKQPEDNS